MRKIKSLGLVTLGLALSLGVVACGSKNGEGTTTELMEKVYADVPADELPMMLTNTELTTDNMEYYLGTTFKFSEGTASEPMIGSIAHSIVLVRVADGEDVNAVVTAIKENINPRKWICVEAEKVEVTNRGNLVLMAMSSTTIVDTVVKSFKAL